MRRTLLLTPALLSACATAPAAPIVHGEIPGYTCQEGVAESYIGRFGTRDAGSAIKRATNADLLRWAPPGVMLTMDYRADRVTVWLGPDKKITRIRCG